MKRSLVLGVAICALLLSAIYAFGDIARPKVSPSPQGPRTVLFTSLAISPDTKLYEARLQISEGTLREIAKEATGSSSNQSMTQRLMHSPTRTIMAGIFMFLAVSFAGVWLARSGQRRNHKAVIAAIVVAAFVGTGTLIVRANAGPPGYIYWQRLPANLTSGKTTNAGVNIEIVPGDESTIKLLVPIRNK